MGDSLDRWFAGVSAKVPTPTSLEEAGGALNQAGALARRLGADATGLYDVLEKLVSTWPKDLRPDTAAVADCASFHLQGPAGIDDTPTTAPVEINPEHEAGDMEAASRFLDRHRQRVRFCHEIGSWYLWDGMRWKRDQEGGVMTLAEETARAEFAILKVQADELFREADGEDDKDKRNALLKKAFGKISEAKAQCSLKRLTSTLTLAQTRPGVSIRLADLDPKPYLLNTPTGIVDLRDGRLYQHDPAHFCTHLTGAEYKPEARSSVFTKVLSHGCQGDAEMATYLQQALGSSLLGGNRFEEFYLVHGEGRDGKGTLFEAIKNAMGDYAATASFQTFLKIDGQRIRNDLARLAGPHLVISSEVAKGSELDSAVIKSLTGGDTIVARFLHREEFEFLPRFTLWLQCNHLPRLDDRDAAIWERLVVVPFGKTVPVDQRDPAVKEKMRSDPETAAAILAWLIQGAVTANGKRHLPRPELVTQRTRAYREELDPSKDFFFSTLRFALPENREQTMAAASDLMNAWKEYVKGAYQQERQAPSWASIAPRLQDLGCRNGPKRVGGKVIKVWVGVTLIHPEAVVLSPHVPGQDEHEKALGMRPDVTVLPRNRTSVNLPTHPPARVLEDRASVRDHTGDEIPFRGYAVTELQDSLSDSEINKKEENKNTPPIDLADLP